MTDRPIAFLQETEPPSGLLATVLARIALARRRAARLRMAVFGTVVLISVLLLIPAVQYALNEFYTSGFYEYASLFFDSLSRGYWQELLYSLADSLPSVALLALAAIGTAFLWSLRQTRESARIAFGRVALPA